MIFLLFGLSSQAAILVDTPSNRIFGVIAESRIFNIDEENRVSVIEYEDRTTVIE